MPAKLHLMRNLYFPRPLLDGMAQIPQYALTIIEAPMGYGKTTAVREFLDKDQTVLWQRIHNKNLTVFWQGFCNNIGVIHKESGKNLSVLGLPEDDISRQEAIQILQALQLPSHTYLVIDDFHLVTSETINDFIGTIIENEIMNLHIVIITRYINLSNMEEFKLKSYVLHLTKEIFEFSQTDIKAYFRKCGTPINEMDASRLYALSEGWISAVYLLMVNYGDNGCVEASVDIYRLIECTLYKNFPEETKELLLRLCFFDNFSLDQAVYVSENPRTQVLLDQVIVENAFVQYDALTKTYHMHNIFTKFLQFTFDRISNDDKIAYYKNTAKYFLHHKQYEPAMAYFYLARDFNQILCIIEDDRGNCMYYEQKAALIAYFEECPKDILNDHPVALLIYALCLFTYHELERFEAAMEEFTALIQQNQTLDEEELSNLMGEFELILSFTVYNDIQKMREHIEKANELMTKPVRSIDTKTSWTFGSPSVLYMFYRESGLLDEEVMNLKAAIGYYNKITSGHGAGGEFMMEAETCFYRGDFENAEIILYHTLYQAKLFGQSSIIICALFLQMRIALFKGDYASVQELLQNIPEEVIANNWDGLIHTMQLCDAFIHSSLNQVNKVHAWIHEAKFEKSKLYFPIKPFFNIVYGRILLVKGDYLMLLGVSRQFIDEAGIFPNLLSLIYAYIYMAAANDRIFRRDEAKEILARALEIALKDQLYIPFVENSDYILPLLGEIHLEGRYMEDINKIKTMAAVYSRNVETIQQDYFSIKKVVLTDRESEIARLASEGFTNAQIGKKLYISENTVKTILKTIFTKLSISNRAFLKHYFEE